MEVKLFEVRDSATFIPVIAVNMKAANAAEKFLLGRVGFIDPEVLTARITEVTIRPLNTATMYGNRTMATAHSYIEEHFDELTSGEVIDVQFILGERSTKKVSERL
jgi:hypothetical protein